MTRTLLTMILCWMNASTIAANVQPTDADAVARAAVLDILSQRSGLPDVELNGFLADCNANQQSMYLCAWRDQVGAERLFERALASKQQKMPQCKAAIASKAASWAQSRDRSCDKSATKQWGEGSLRPTARAICVTVETVKMTKRLERMVSCRH